MNWCNLANTQGFRITGCIVAVLLVILAVVFIWVLIAFLIRWIRIKKNNLKISEKHKERAQKKQNCRMIVQGRAKTEMFALSLCIETCIFGCCCMADISNQYEIKDKFAWGKDSAVVSNVTDSYFVKAERPSVKFKEDMEKTLHYDWGEERFSGEHKYITKEDMEFYCQKAKDIFFNVPLKDSKEAKVQLPDNLKAQDRIYNTYSQKNPQNLSDTECYMVYEACEALSSWYQTSEMQFQTAVWAENALTNMDENKVRIDDARIYASKTIENFEKFLDFKTLMMGENKCAEKTDVFFRMGKANYKLCQWERDYSDENVRHLVLCAYGEFKIILQQLEKIDPYYLLSLCYLTNICMEMMPFINDEGLRQEICNEIKELWKPFRKLDEKKVQIYELEGMTLESVLQIRDTIEQY